MMDSDLNWLIWRLHESWRSFGGVFQIISGGYIKKGPLKVTVLHFLEIKWVTLRLPLDLVVRVTRTCGRTEGLTLTLARRLSDFRFSSSQWIRRNTGWARVGASKIKWHILKILVTYDTSHFFSALKHWSSNFLVVWQCIIRKEVRIGPVRESNPGPLAPKARIMPLDQQADENLMFSVIVLSFRKCHLFPDTFLPVLLSSLWKQLLSIDFLSFKMCAIKGIYNIQTSSAFLSRS